MQGRGEEKGSGICGEEESVDYQTQFSAVSYGQ